MTHYALKCSYVGLFTYVITTKRTFHESVKRKSRDTKSMQDQSLTFPGDEGFPTARALVIEKDSVASKHVVGLAVVDAHPKRV